LLRVTLMDKGSKSDEIDIIKKSTSCLKMSTMYINGMTYSIFGGVSEFDVQKRKGWIERKIRQTGDDSIDNVVECIKLSQFWLNYVELGSRYPNLIDDATYREWDKDRLQPKLINTKRNKPNRSKHNRNRSHYQNRK